MYGKISGEHNINIKLLTSGFSYQPPETINRDIRKHLYLTDKWWTNGLLFTFEFIQNIDEMTNEAWQNDR